MSRYESLLNRAQAATKAVDELDLLRLQRAKVDNGTGSNSSIATTNTTNTSSNTTPNASIVAENNVNTVGKYCTICLNCKETVKKMTAKYDDIFGTFEHS